LVTGASSGFGRATTVALLAAGANVVAVARNTQRLAESRDELGGLLTTVTADVADPIVAGSLLEQHRPKTLVLNAGASPLMRPLQHHTWDTFNRNWEVDVRQAFHWTREALLLPLAPQSTVIALSSGAALFGPRSAAAMPAPRQQSGSSPPTAPTNPRARDSASASSRCCPS